VRSLSDDELLARVRREPAAFGVFYERHERAVLGYFMRRTGDPEVAADLAAETFAAALMSVRRYRAGAGPALAWLYGIARHKLARSAQRRQVEDRARRKLGWPRLELDDELLEVVARSGAEQRAETLLARLPPDQASAVRARIIDEEPYETIAGRLECSESVVRQRVSRGLVTLRALVREEI
jgi:RNA polymerase sigma factor (sigma-70 family)